MNFYNLYRVTVFLLGLTSTLIIFKFDIGIGSVYFYDLFFYLLLIVLFIYIFIKKKFRIHILKSKWIKIFFFSYSIFLIILIYSIIIPISDNAAFMWIFGNLKASINKWVPTLILMMFLYLISPKHQETFYIYFIKGFIFSIFIHAGWSIIALILWFGYKIPLNHMIINSMNLNIGHNAYSLAYPGILRMSGLHWDPAWFGILGPMALFWIQIFIKKYILKIFFSLFIFIPWVFTFSRTGAFSFGIAILFVFINKVSTINKSIIRKKTIKKILIGSFILTMIVLALLPVYQSYSDTINGIISMRTNIKSSSGTSRHFNYITDGYKVLGTNGPQHFLFGFGYRNGGRGLTNNNYLEQLILVSENFSKKNYIWSPESDLAKILIETGVIGFILYLVYNLSICRSCYLFISKNIEYKYSSFFIIVFIILFFGGIFYTYIDDRWFHLLILSYFSFAMSKEVFLRGEDDEDRMECYSFEE